MLTSVLPALAAPPSGWDQSPESRARLIAAAGLESGAYLAGIEIELSGGAHTYWRTPGDTGVPPTISFSNSTNLARAELRWPAPRKLVEAGSETFGYLDRLVIPLAVTPADASKPVGLDVVMNYATCERICIPARAKLHMTLAPTDSAGPEAALLRQWVDTVPKPLDAPGAPKLSVVPRAPSASGKPQWHVEVEPASSATTLFPEAPDGWFVVARKAAPTGFDLEAVEAPRAPAAQALPLGLTIVEGRDAWATTLRLDAAQSKP